MAYKIQIQVKSEESKIPSRKITSMTITSLGE